MPTEPPGPPLKPEYIEAMALSEPVRNAIKKFDSGFKMWEIEDFSDEQSRNYPYSAKALPYAIKGDYNSDGIEDIVLSGRNYEGNVSLALLSSGANYKIVKVATGDDNYSRAEEQKRTRRFTPACVLRHISKGKKVDTTSDSAASPSYKILETDGFFIQYGGEQDANLHFWNTSRSKFDLIAANIVPIK